MKYICAQPASLYYAWQVEVMLNNFMKVGINLNDVEIVCSIDSNIPEEWVKLATNYPARFFFYKDKREKRNYISSIRPNILRQHFVAYPELKKEVIFYHDCDIVFSRPINWNQFEHDKIFYGSDTRWYISYDYIISKGQDVFNSMTDIVCIDPQLIIDNRENSIGAQYILKNIDEHFWKDVENDSENLFTNITKLSNDKKKEDPDYHTLQIWCADMWALLWNIWKRGYETKCHTDLQFSWSTSSEKDYYNHNIMHNAGVTSDEDGLFYKAKYIRTLPYNLNLNIKDNTASKKYYEWVKKTESKSVLL
jgi:hypothetical protein